MLDLACCLGGHRVHKHQNGSENAKDLSILLWEIHNSESNVPRKKPKECNVQQLREG